MYISLYPFDSLIETDAKKSELALNMVLGKLNLHFLSNKANIKAMPSTNEVVILVHFHKDWPKTVEFLVIV